MADEVAQCRSGGGFRLFRFLAAEWAAEQFKQFITAVKVDDHGLVYPHDIGRDLDAATHIHGADGGIDAEFDALGAERLDQFPQGAGFDGNRAGRARLAPR